MMIITVLINIISSLYGIQGEEFNVDVDATFKGLQLHFYAVALNAKECISHSINFKERLLRLITDAVYTLYMYNVTYRLFVLSSSDRRQQRFTTYLGPLKKLLPKILTKLDCQKQPKAVQPAQPTSQSCQKNELQKNIQYICLKLIFRQLWLVDFAGCIFLAVFCVNLCENFGQQFFSRPMLPGLNFINILRPESVKFQLCCKYLFALLGSACVKAAPRTLMKVTPGVGKTYCE